MNQHLLTLTIFSPLAGVVALLLIPRSQEIFQRTVALLSSLVTLGLALLLWNHFRGTGEWEFFEAVPWMSGFRIDYRVGVDGFSLPLLLLTALLVPLVILQAWKDFAGHIKGFLICILLVEVSVLGVFSALDLFLFYVFWEVMIVPMYFLIGIWGGSRRVEAAMKFVLFTLAGSLLMLAAILILYFAGGKSFNLADLYGLAIPHRTQVWLFAAFALAFAIKIPLFPFHTWLPDAHVEAPTGGSVLLAGVLLKMGAYGLLRFGIPLLPEGAEALLPLIGVLAVIGIVYGSLVAWVQPDLKKLVAYTSVAHMGFIVLGIVSKTHQGLMGAGVQMLNHGISTGALFLLVGMIYERKHTREIQSFGGLATPMPLYSLIFLTVLFSSIGLPGTNGFVGEFLILAGSFKFHPVLTAVAASGVVLGAIALLGMAKKVFWGPVSDENRQLVDLNAREIILMIPLLLLILWIGLGSGFLTQKMDKSVSRWLDRTSLVR